MTNMVTGGSPSLSASDVDHEGLVAQLHVERLGGSIVRGQCLLQLVNSGGVDGAHYFPAGAHHRHLAGGHARELLSDGLR